MAHLRYKIPTRSLKQSSRYRDKRLKNLLPHNFKAYRPAGFAGRFQAESSSYSSINYNHFSTKIEMCTANFCLLVHRLS